MSKLNKLMGFVARSVIAGLAIAFVIIYLWPSLQRAPAENEATAVSPVPAVTMTYADAVDRAAPAVVSLYTKSLTSEPIKSGSGRAASPLLFRLTGDQGSGVIMSENGYILTNMHVINRVTEINVALWDGRSIRARVVGADPATDLAVLKIDLEGLPVAPLGDSTELRVGDVVLAIGNSLGLSHTVTMGIVSGTGRNKLRSLLYEDFIQTDAAINSGNSGGALVNARGELIGINTRAGASTRSAQNIGFAIPLSLARHVMDQIIEHGTVQRGWLGAAYGDLRPTAQADGSSIRLGIAVREVQRGGPAWNAGIRQGDEILKLDGEMISDPNDFLLAISQRAPGSKVELEVRRNREVFETYATLIQQPPLR